jgi:hypothetical protein
MNFEIRSSNCCIVEVGMVLIHLTAMRNVTVKVTPSHSFRQRRISSRVAILHLHGIPPIPVKPIQVIVVLFSRLVIHTILDLVTLHSDRISHDLRWFVIHRRVWVLNMEPLFLLARTASRVATTRCDFWLLEWQWIGTYTVFTREQHFAVKKWSLCIDWVNLIIYHLSGHSETGELWEEHCGYMKSDIWCGSCYLHACWIIQS